MSERNIQFSVGEYYHLYNRGVDKRTIFTNAYEHKRFLLLLYLCNSDKGLNMRDLLNKGISFAELFSYDRGSQVVHIGAYGLMPNHFHLLVREVVEGGITVFMRKLSTSYASFFNQVHDRSGALFQGKFKAQHVNEDRYLRYLFSYIHLNPVKLVDPKWKENGIRDRAEARRYLDAYEYSSFFDYRGDQRPQTTILDRDAFPDYLATRSNFEAHTEDFFTYNN